MREFIAYTLIILLMSFSAAAFFYAVIKSDPPYRHRDYHHVTEWAEKHQLERVGTVK